MFYDSEEIRKQMQPVEIPDVSIGDDVSNVAQATRKILNRIEEKQIKYESEQKAQKRINVVMLVFSIIAAISALISAVISVLSLC